MTVGLHTIQILNWVLNEPRNYLELKKTCVQWFAPAGYVYHLQATNEHS